MSTRTFEELKDAVNNATRNSDAASLMECAEELHALATSEAEAVAHTARGVGFALGSNYPAALEHYHHALAMHEELGNRSGVARVTMNIGNVYRNSGDYHAALEQLHRALAMHQELGDRSGVARVTNGIGVVHYSTGNYPAALEHYHRALAMHEELGDSSDVALVTGNIGGVHYHTGIYPSALEHFHRALAMHEQLGDLSYVARATGNIGNVHHFTGNYPAALEHYHRALAMHEELGDRSGVAVVTGNIGNVHSNTGNYLAGLEHYRRAIAIHEELGNRSDVVGVIGNIITAMIGSGEHAEAEALLQTMDTLQIDNPHIVVQKEQSRASLQEHHGTLDEARATLRAALLIAQEHTLVPKQADIHKSLRDLALKQNDLAGYVEHNNEFTRITEEVNGKETATKMAMQEKQREIDAVQREHQKHMAVLHSTLPKHIADRVARGETVNDHHENAALIFLDIVGFTSISDRIPSGHVVHLLEQIFTTLDAVCEKHNVVKIKTIGDSYMAVSFGTANSEERTANSGHIYDAATCALEMIASLDTLVITMPPSLGETSWTNDIGEIKVRIGMHCGPVTAGVIGTARMQYDVWGDTVNVASRMESTSEPGKIHVSEAFATLLPATSSGDSFERPLQVLERGEIEVKGKGMMKTYWLE
ncbi:MAG: tetratricopeptide repeat protein [Ignavibacteria bacterium]|nr:tetratricopeptide repeat protein [Ignavibacteria bacterium]